MKTASREFVVDGYNLIHKLIPSPSASPLEQLRLEMEKKLLSFQRKNRCAVTIVYDGKASAREHSSIIPLHIVFTPATKSADQWIIDYVKSLNTNVKKVTIVSSDDEIRRYSEAFGARCIKSEAFALKLGENGTSAPLSEGKRRSGFGKTIDKAVRGEPLSDKEVAQWAELFTRGKM
ncbi:MAG: NYN domain-containing protein [Chlorobiaceae bacterium]|nr:NYN domain-containing protein [Chlorobiaceae bacterium]